MRNLTPYEKLKFAEEENKFSHEHKDFVNDIRQISFLMKGSINFDEGINILAPTYKGKLTNNDRSFVMTEIEATLKRAGLFKEGRILHDCNKENREMFVGLCPNSNEKAITIFAIDDSFKDEYIIKTIDFVDDKKIFVLAIGKTYEDFLDKVGVDNTEIIESFIHLMKGFVNLAYPDLDQYHSIPAALSSLFLTVASFHPTEFTDNLFADEEHGWFYDSIFNTDKYMKMSCTNLTNMVNENDPLANLFDDISSSEIEELTEFSKDVITCIAKFLIKKPIATEDAKHAIKRFDYMNPKKEKYTKNVDIDEWLDTPLYSSICNYKDEKYIIAISECFSKPKLTENFPTGHLITVSGNINGSEKEVVKIAYDILKLIVYDFSDDEETEKVTLGGIFAIASALGFKMIPDTFELISDEFIKANVESYLKFREDALGVLKSVM